MEFFETGIDGLVEIIPQKYQDSRGYFFESYNEKTFKAGGISVQFVQDNQAYSPKGVLRGLHLQKEPYGQAKLVRILKGRVIDVVVDLRKDSATFGKSFSIELDSESQKMLFVPVGFAHGYVTLEDTLFFYKCSNFYHKESESGLLWNDPELNIDWGIKNPIISDKDSKLPTFEEFRENFL